MYLAHFALQQLPFSLTPNTGFYVGLNGHQQAMDVLQTALGQGEGFIKVTGEVGTGKTLLCRKLLNEAPAHWSLAYIPDPNLDPQQLRWALALELGLKQSANIDQQQLAHLLQRQLLLLAGAGRQVVLLIDEAQALPDETLEALRLMTNLETEQRKLVQVVLFGQPELDRRLALPKFRQLRQRISFSYQLPQLQYAEVAAYLQQRLQTAGSREVLFSTPAVWLLSYYSRGIPRLINVLAHKALLLAYGAGLQRAGWRQLVLAALDTEDVQQPVRRWLWVTALGLSLLLLVSWPGGGLA
jgi:MSHA biogenesis protein MshM